MKNTTVAFFAVFLFIFLTTSTVAEAATFPIEEDFSGVQPGDWVLRAAAEWNTSVSGDATLQLTPVTESNTGLGFFNDSFPSNLGIVAEFRYYNGGGTGADGLAFFLVDGDQVNHLNIETGALGGALGYAQSSEDPGIPHAYLGVGFDEFGNFVTGSGGMDEGSATAIPDSVVVRGSGNGTTGYEYLTHRNVFSAFGQRIDGGWRIARVTVVPTQTDATIRVEMSWDEGETWHTVINDYVYDEVPPENLKLGFTGGTGGSTNIHAIGDLTVSLPVDLETDVTVAPTGTYERGDAFTYTYTVENHGPNDSATTTITNTLPIGDLGITNLTWNLTSTHGATTSGTGSSINSINVAIPSGETVTIVVSGTIGNAIINSTNLDHVISAVSEAGTVDPSPSDAAAEVDITTSAPTASESALLKIVAYASSNGTTSAPTTGDYTTAGISGVNAQNLTDMNTAVADSGVSTLEEIQDLVDEMLLPELETLAASSITRTGAWMNGVIDRIGDVDILSSGFEFGLTTSYGNSIHEYRTNPGTYQLELQELTCGTTYHFRAYIENHNDDRWYGEDKTFVTSSCASGSSASKPSARSTSETKSESPTIAALKEKILILQKQLAALKGGNTTVDTTQLSVRDLTVGDTGEDVRALQLLLIEREYAIPAGATAYFGTQTRDALASYQMKNAISPSVGYFGAITRAQMKAAGLGSLWW